MWIQICNNSTCIWHMPIKMWIVFKKNILQLFKDVCVHPLCLTDLYVICSVHEKSSDIDYWGWFLDLSFVYLKSLVYGPMVT